MERAQLTRCQHRVAEERFGHQLGPTAVAGAEPPRAVVLGARGEPGHHTLLAVVGEHRHPFGAQLVARRRGADRRGERPASSRASRGWSTGHGRARAWPPRCATTTGSPGGASAANRSDRRRARREPTAPPPECHPDWRRTTRSRCPHRRHGRGAPPGARPRISCPSSAGAVNDLVTDVSLDMIRDQLHESRSLEESLRVRPFSSGTRADWIASSIGTGRLKRNPCARSQSRSRSASIWKSVSTPSATTVNPSDLASAMAADDDGGLLRARPFDAADERTIDLQVVRHGEVTHVVKRRVTGAEVVDGDANPQGLQPQ